MKNRFARPDTSPTKTVNTRAKTDEDDETYVVTHGTSFTATRQYSEVNDELKRQISSRATSMVRTVKEEDEEKVEDKPDVAAVIVHENDRWVLVKLDRCGFGFKVILGGSEKRPRVYCDLCTATMTSL